jgi:hypothetical protein
MVVVVADAVLSIQKAATPVPDGIKVIPDGHVAISASAWLSALVLNEIVVPFENVILA